MSVLWDGTTTWVLLEGDERDVEAQAGLLALSRGRRAAAAARPAAGGRCRPMRCARCPGTFVAEVGVGVVHHAEPAPPRPVDPAILDLHRRLKERFDPTGRLNPGVDPLAP